MSEENPIGLDTRLNSGASLDLDETGEISLEEFILEEEKRKREMCAKLALEAIGEPNAQVEVITDDPRHTWSYLRSEHGRSALLLNISDAKDENNNGFVVGKLIEFEGNNSRSTWQNEADILTNLSDVPGLVRCRGKQISEDLDSGVIVLDYVDGMKLASWIELTRVGDKKTPKDALGKVLTRTSNTFAHMHARGVAHGDISPENAMVSEDFEETEEGVVVIDVGNSPKVLGNKQEGTTKKALIHYPYYAPERRSYWESDGLADDVFSYGVMLRKMFSKDAFLKFEYQNSDGEMITEEVGWYVSPGKEHGKDAHDRIMKGFNSGAYTNVSLLPLDFEDFSIEGLSVGEAEELNRLMADMTKFEKDKRIGMGEVVERLKGVFG